MIKVALLTIVSLTLTALCPAWSAEQDEAALIKAVSGAKVTLQQGLTASQREGRPISAKFEMENGKLQLSVYTEKAGKYFEVIVDHMTGSVAKTEPITEGDDLADAKAQSAAMAKAKTDLKSATTRAAVGSRAVAVPFKFLDRFGQLGTAAPALPAVFQNASAQELSDVLQLVDRQTLQKAPCWTLLRILQASNQRAH